MSQNRVVFENRRLPLLLLLPQLAIPAVFFLWPAMQAVHQSFLIEDAFGLSSKFVWLDNYWLLAKSADYRSSFFVTVIFSLSTAFVAMSIALLFASAANNVIRGNSVYKTLLIWPYGVAPAIAGVLWLFMFNPANGVLALALREIGYDFNAQMDTGQALALVVAASAWKQVAYNFVFFLAGMQAIPKSLIEAAAIDGAGPMKRFWTIVFPLLSPTTFFLLVINIVYAFFETFGVIHTVTQGGPARGTEILVYKVYEDGFIGLDLGGSSAQSTVLMIIVIVLTFIQFRFVERRVHY